MVKKKWTHTLPLFSVFIYSFFFRSLCLTKILMDVIVY